MPEDRNQSDHDLLLTLRAEFQVEMTNVKDTLKDIKDNVVKRINDLEFSRATTKDLDEVKSQLESLKKFMWTLGGIGAVVAIAIEIAIKVFK